MGAKFSQQQDDNTAAVNTDGLELATFGAGCFWGTEKFFRKQFKDQLASTMVGYMGGSSKASYDMCALERQTMLKCCKWLSIQTRSNTVIWFTFSSVCTIQRL